MGRSLVHHWASKIGVNVQQIHLRQMKTKWASILGGTRTAVAGGSPLKHFDIQTDSTQPVHPLLGD